MFHDAEKAASKGGTKKLCKAARSPLFGRRKLPWNLIGVVS
jgi:hypothetical protein